MHSTKTIDHWISHWFQHEFPNSNMPKKGNRTEFSSQLGLRENMLGTGSLDLGSGSPMIEPLSSTILQQFLKDNYFHLRTKPKNQQEHTWHHN
jgi:hypothetical protein